MRGHSNTYVTEGGTHNDRLVAVLLVVVVDALDGLDTGVLVTLVGFACRLLVPVKDLKADRGCV